jgi:hypothetical protein
MASFVNKISNSVTNATGGLVGREALTKLSNSLNKAFTTKSKYRDFLVSGNVVQLVSRNSQKSLQILSVEDQPALLYLNGNGKIGAEAPNSHFKLMINPKNGHYTFSNLNNYLTIDTLSSVPCIKPEPPKKKKKPAKIPVEFEFRLHEIFGSDEYFSLEFIGRPGNYLAVLPNGIVQTTTDKTDKNSHLSMNLIFKLVQNSYSLVPNPTMATNYTNVPVVSASEPANGDSLNAAKREEADANETASVSESHSSSLEETPDVPPDYTSLYPRLPKSL